MKGDLAKEIFSTGKNCCQAVVLAFKEEIGLSEEQLSKLSIGLGGGLARLRLTCGAVSGMAIVLSALKSDGQDKLKIYELIRRAVKDFETEVGSIICSELLDGVPVKNQGTGIPEERTTEYYKKRPCGDLCKLAGDIAEKYIKE